MLLLDLADACRASGLDVVELPGWQDRGHGQMAGVRSIICHHTAGPPTGDTPSLRVVRDGRAGLPGPLAQVYLSRSGGVYVVAAGLAYHAGAVFSPSTQGNLWAIGVEAEATGVDPWPPVQYDAYARLCAALRRHYGLGTDRVLGHKEVAKPAGRKIDPNFSMIQFRAAVAAVPAEGAQMDARQAAQLDTTLQQITGSPDPWTFVGWDENFVPPTGNLTLVDLCRRVIAQNRALAAEVAEMKAILAKVAAGNVDYQSLATAVADELHRRLAGPAGAAGA
ncbi:MAG: N-acetylmuramoyl-L-alanine amidase [Pseudonocardia sp.]|nr:N-acetylmuramoyl-L-alanine amidase [Pseudonocardia sp.]